MHLLFIILLFLHGLIHGIGFIKSIRPNSISKLILPVKKSTGAVWLFALILFWVASGLVMLSLDWWWIIGMIAVILSQSLVISEWRDAKAATIPNVIILLVAIVGFGSWQFDRNTNHQLEMISQQSKMSQVSGRAVQDFITEEHLLALPPPVQQWLMRSGIIGRKPIKTVTLEQKGVMKTEPDQEQWMETEARQFINVLDPSFIWTVRMQMMPLVFIMGRDVYAEGTGQMLIKPFGILSVVDETSEEINQATLQRFLSEIVWYPSAALSDRITWEKVDSLSARATMSHHSVSGNVTFHFTNKGDVKRITADRYMGGERDAELRPWIISIIKSENVGPIRIPTEVELSWDLDDGLFTWYRFEVTHYKPS